MAGTSCPRPWLALALALVPACAGGVENPDTTFGPPGGPAPATGSDDDVDGATFEDPFPDPDPIDTTTGFPPDETTTSVGDGTTTFEPPPGDSTTDGGMTGDCPNVDTCPGASGIGQVSGDTGSRTIGTSGSEATWIKFQVTEDDDALVGAPMSFTVTLISPAGADFDLYVYRGMEGGSTGCNGFMEQSTSAGQDSVDMAWGEGLAANGLDDGVWVAVEIRAKDDVCSPLDEWVLEVEGNT